MENDELPCADQLPEREDHLAYPTLFDVVAAMKADDFKPNLSDSPAFLMLEEAARMEREDGSSPPNGQLDTIIADLEPENYDSTGGNLQCMKAFKSLRYIAERQKRMQQNEENHP